MFPALAIKIVDKINRPNSKFDNADVLQNGLISVFLSIFESEQ